MVCVIYNYSSHKKHGNMDGEIEELVCSTTQQVFGYTPRPFQVAAVSQLIRMSLGMINTRPLFICQPTGGSKSLVRDVFAVAVAGIIINIAPLLSLNADQNNKLKSKARCRNIHSFHLHEYNENCQIDRIIEFLLNYPKNSPVCVLLFVSPQRIVEYPQYTNLVNELMAKGTLKLISIDEVQLFTQFGIWFRLEFYKLKDVLFNKALFHNIPILFMTASANKLTIHHLELLTGIQFKINDFLWPTAEGMQCRKQLIQYEPGNQYNRVLRREISTLNMNKFIVYGNLRERIENHLLGLCMSLGQEHPFR